MTMSSHHNEEPLEHAIHVPAPTAWPMVFAVGLGLILMGMVTSVVISLLGLLLAVRAGFGWFSEVLPVQELELYEVPLDAAPMEFLHMPAAKRPEESTHRKVVPLERFKFSTGIKGGIAGGIAMIVPATLFSVLKYHSIWYAMNLLAAGGFVSWAGASNAFLSQFHMEGFLAALAIHIVTSLLVGSLYGAMLPIFPRYPIVTAGFVAPFLWTGILYSSLGIVSPILNQRIDWFWFVISQIAFGLVAGFVVNLDMRVRTPQFRALPLGVRAGIATDQGNERLEDEKEPE
jgi:hypothetical protein